MGEWREGCLSDVCESIDYGLTASASTDEVGPKFLRITDIVGTALNWRDVPFVKATEKETEKYKLFHGDIVIARTGATTGESRFIIEPPSSVFASYLVRLRINHQNDARFVSYWLKSPAFRGYLHGVLGDKSAQPNASASTMTQAPIRMPASLKEQRAIAAVLGALDDKIELNRRMNETLESMARVIFKDWFVDFGPTRAKTKGSTPYLESGIWDLFPDSFDGEDKPFGWDHGAPLDLGKLISGGTPKTKEPDYWGGGIQWASAKDISACRNTFLIETERTITDLGLEKSSTKIIPKLATVVVARGATTGRYCMFGSDIAMNQTCYALQDRDGHDFFMYCWFGNLVSKLVHAAHGSVFDTITTSTFKNARTLIPPPQLRSAFEAIADPIYRCVLSNVHEAHTLARIRNLLLPKLMSGDIRLRDAELVVEAVA